LSTAASHDDLQWHEQHPDTGLRGNALFARGSTTPYAEDSRESPRKIAKESRWFDLLRIVSNVLAKYYD